MINMGPETNALQRLIWLRGNPATGGGMGSVDISLTAGAARTEMTLDKKSRAASCAVSFSPYQWGTGDPSPTNIRPVSGAHGIKVNVAATAAGAATQTITAEFPVAGKNMAEIIEDGKVPNLATGELVSGSGCRTDYISVEAGQAYTLSISENYRTTNYWLWYTADKTFIYKGQSQTPTKNLNVTIYAPENAAYFMLRTTYGKSLIKTCQLEKGTTATAYEAPSHAVYGGVYDPVTGVVTATYKVIEYDDATGFSAHNSGRWYKNALPDGLDTANKTSSISNQASYGDKNLTYSAWFAFGASGIYINKLTSAETIEEFEERLQATPFVVCYPLATPITIPVPAEQLTLPAGTSYLWANAEYAITAEGAATQGLPLTITDAKAGSISSLIRYGQTELTASPSMSSPAQVNNNNGTVTFDDWEVPAEYRRLQGLTFAGNTYYQIYGVTLNGWDNIDLTISVNSACNVFGCYSNTSATNNYSLYVSTTSGAKYLRYNGGAYKSYWSASALGEQFSISIGPEGSTGMPSGQDDTWEAVDFEGTEDFCIGTTSPDATSAKFNGTIYGTIVVSYGMYTFIPCERISDGVLGYYEPASQAFYEPIGSAPTALGYDGSYRSQATNGYEDVVVGNKSVTNTADLYAADGKADTQDLVTGTVMRSTEMRVYIANSFSTYAAGVYYHGNYNANIVAAGTPLCTHFTGVKKTPDNLSDGEVTIYDNKVYFKRTACATAGDFETWIADQYSRGTPVIVVAPFSAPFKDNSSMSPQTFPISAGSTNVYAVTNGELSELPRVKVVYEGEV